MNRQKLLKYAFQKSIPVLLGYVFLGIAFGIVLQRSGLNWLWALAISVLIYAGSMQFALVSLLSTAAPLTTVAIMTLMVNSRHLFYGLSFVEKYKAMGKLRPYMIFSLTDETYSVLCSCKDEPESTEDNSRACFYISLLHQCYWVLGSVIGAIAGELIAFDTTGIDFSMTALFTVILVDQLRSGGKEALVSAAIGIVFAVIFLLWLGATNFLLPTLCTTVIALLVKGQLQGGAAHE